MKANKKIIIVLLIVFIVIGLSLLAYSYLSSNIFEKEVDSKTQLIQSIKDIEDINTRKESIEHFIESNILTQEEANSLY